MQLKIEGDDIMLAVARVQPGDVVILQLTKRFLNNDQRDRLTVALSHYFPANKCMVLEEGLALEIVRPQ